MRFVTGGGGSRPTGCEWTVGYPDKSLPTPPISGETAKVLGYFGGKWAFSPVEANSADHWHEQQTR